MVTYKFFMAEIKNRKGLFTVTEITPETHYDVKNGIILENAVIEHDIENGMLTITGQAQRWGFHYYDVSRVVNAVSLESRYSLDEVADRSIVEKEITVGMLWWKTTKKIRYVKSGWVLIKGTDPYKAVIQGTFKILPEGNITNEDM